MKALASARIAIRALRVNKLRSILTMLGIIIGVAAVIAMVSIGSGAQARIAEQIQSLGSNLLVVLSGSISQGGVRLGSGSQLTITEEDAWAIQREISGVHAAAPAMRGGGQVVWGNLNWSTTIQGVTPEFFEARDWPIVIGQPFGQDAVDGATKVALLGQTVARNLFAEENPVGQIIRIKKVPFTVLGVLDKKGQNDLGAGPGRSHRGAAVHGQAQAPRREPGQRALGQLDLRQGARRSGHEGDGVADARAPPPAAPAPGLPGRRLLHPQPRRGRRDPGGLVPGHDHPARRGRLRVAPGGRHRHHEHHARVGDGADARDRPPHGGGGAGRDILGQFLVEAVTLSMIGGLIGIVVGIIVSYTIPYFAGWRTVISPEAIVLAFVFAAAVGIFFGFYPARKAAMLNPIEALRYE